MLSHKMRGRKYSSDFNKGNLVNIIKSSIIFLTSYSIKQTMSHKSRRKNSNQIRNAPHEQQHATSDNLVDPNTDARNENPQIGNVVRELR